MMTALLGLERKPGNETVEVGAEVLLKEPGEHGGVAAGSGNFLVPAD